MLSNDSAHDPKLAEPQASQRRATAEKGVLPMKPRDEIEVAASGSGTMNDPPGKDTSPPGIAYLDHFA